MKRIVYAVILSFLTIFVGCQKEPANIAVEKLTLNITSIEITEGNSTQIFATISPDDATNKKIIWYTSNSAIATVNNGLITAVAPGNAIITASSDGGKITATCTVSVISFLPPSPPTRTAGVDLGLSVNWAACNLGAASPKDVGGYYQWAGTQDVTSTSIFLDNDNCPYHNTESNQYNRGWLKYIPLTRISYWGGNGSPDHKSVLDPDDDAAHVNLEDKWRIPTFEEWKELIDNCVWIWITKNGVHGYEIKSKKPGYENNSIFLPTTGWRHCNFLDRVETDGIYWSSSLEMDGPDNAYALAIRSNEFYLGRSERESGLAVRPVFGDRIYATGVSLNKNSLSLDIEEMFTLSAILFPSNAMEQNVSWSSSDTSVATVDPYGTVTGVKDGSATITVKTIDGGHMATCAVTVTAKKFPVTGVSLNKKSTSIVVGDSEILLAIFSPSNASDKSLNWTSDNTSVATVEQSGKVTAVKDGNATIIVKTSDGGYTATCAVTVKSLDDITGREAVDLGLSIKWASCNLGATSPEEYGGYYQWAGLVDVTSTSIYLDWNNCPYHIGSNRETGWTKYIGSGESYWSGSGSPDYMYILDADDDVAHVYWGGKWRMPTDMEWTELIDNCTWTSTTQNGVKGFKITSNIPGYTSNSIFLPATGYRYYDVLYEAGYYCHYWSSTVDAYPFFACRLDFMFGGDIVYSYDRYRYQGHSVRPVSE